MYGQQPLELFYQIGERQEAPKGSVLYDSESEEDRNACYFLESGCVALVGLTKSGEERIIVYCERKGLVGFMQLMPIFHGNRRSEDPLPTRIVAKTPSVLYRVPGEAFMEQLRTNTRFSEYIALIQSENYRNLIHRFHVSLDECATVRLCDLLLEHVREEEGDLMMPSFFNYAELGRYLGIHVVTVSRIMVQLKSRGFIEKRGHRIVLRDPDGLQRLINERSNFDF